MDQNATATCLVLLYPGQNFLDTQDGVSYTSLPKKEVLINFLPSLRRPLPRPR
jgi:hypothetical protein